MGHGTPDWWGGAPKSTTYALGDMAELAARLGSIDTFDRRGDVVFLDSFDHGLCGWTADEGDTGAVYPVCHPVRSKGLSLELMAGDLALDWVDVKRTFPFPALGGIGGEISFMVAAYLKYLTLQLVFMDGTNYYSCQVRYDHALGKVYVYTDPTTWTEVGSPGVLSEAVTTFHTMKLVVDTLANKYVRLLVDNHTYSIGAHTPDYGLDATTPQVTLLVMVTCASANFTYLNLDDVILTQNEPS